MLFWELVLRHERQRALQMLQLPGFQNVGKKRIRWIAKSMEEMPHRPDFSNSDHRIKLYMLRILDPESATNFSIPDPGSKRHRISGSVTKNLSIFNQNIVTKLSEIWSGMFMPDPGSGFLPSWSPEPGVKTALDPGSDPQHCLQQ